MTFTESTPEYSRISGEDMAQQKKAEDLQKVIDLFDSLSFRPHELRHLKTFNEVFVAAMIIKYHLMVSKQKDYGPGNIGRAGPLGILTRVEDKLQRLKQLVGSPEQQVETIKKLIENLPDDADANDLDEFAWNVDQTVNPTNAVKGETIDDTWMDTGNYGDIGYVEHHGAWGKPLQ